MLIESTKSLNLLVFAFLPYLEGEKLKTNSLKLCKSQGCPNAIVVI